jgi:hypothetical protein
MNASKEMMIRDEAWFEADPLLCSPVRGQTEAELERLKGRLLKPFLEKINHTSLAREILWAANEAAALAWFTVCPVLILPTLLEEKVRAAIGRWNKQARLFHASACRSMPNAQQ